MLTHEIEALMETARKAHDGGDHMTKEQLKAHTLSTLDHKHYSGPGGVDHEGVPKMLRAQTSKKIDEVTLRQVIKMLQHVHAEAVVIEDKRHKLHKKR